VNVFSIGVIIAFKFLTLLHSNYIIPIFIFSKSAEGQMTSRVISIMRRYETNNLNVMQVVSSTNSGEGSQTMNMKRKKLTEATNARQETLCDVNVALSLSLSHT
jgi:hypothetical protein